MEINKFLDFFKTQPPPAEQEVITNIKEEVKTNPDIPVPSEADIGKIQVDPADNLESAWNNSFYGHSFDYNQFQKDLKKFELTQNICDLIDQVCLTHELISNAYNLLLNTSDTEIEIDLELESGNEVQTEEALTFINKVYPKYFNRSALNQVSTLIMGSIIRYGFYASNLIIDTNLLAIIQIPTHLVSWRKTLTGWTPVFKGDKEIDINPNNFVFGGFMIENNKGIFPNSLIKCSLKNLHVSEFFSQGLSKIIEKFSLFKTITNINKLEEFEKASLIDKANDTLSTDPKNKNTTAKRIIKNVSQALNTINKDYKVPVISSPLGVEFKTLDTYQAPQNLTEIKRLIETSMINALKVPASLLGVTLQENQTTLSEQHKLIFKQTILSIQEHTASIIKKHLLIMLASYGYLVKDLSIEFKPPELESELTLEQARSLKLDNEMKEYQLENLKNTQDVQANSAEPATEEDTAQTSSVEEESDTSNEEEL